MPGRWGFQLLPIEMQILPFSALPAQTLGAGCRTGGPWGGDGAVGAGRGCWLQGQGAREMQHWAPHSHTSLGFASPTVHFFGLFTPDFPFFFPHHSSLQLPGHAGVAARIRSRRDPAESPTSGVHVPAYKYSTKLCAVYPEPLCWRWVLAEQTRPTPLGKHSIFYLNVKQGSCSLDAQPPAGLGRADGWHRGPTAVPRLAAAGAGPCARSGEGAAWLSESLTSAFLQVLLSQQWQHGAGRGRQHPLPPWGPQPVARAHGPSWPLPPRPSESTGTASLWHCDSAPSRKTKGGPPRVPRARG